MLRKAVTLLLITRQTLARIDVVPGSNPKVLRHWQRTRFESESLATLVDATCRLGKRKPGTVVVLADQFWNGVVGLPHEIVAGIGGSELLQAIALECESYSGISAFESTTAACPIHQDASGDKRWWVTQIANADIRAIIDAVQQCGGTLVGLANPASARLPLSLATNDNRHAADSSPGSVWKSVQSWGGNVVAIRGEAKRVMDVLVLDGHVGQPRIQEALRGFLHSPGQPAITDSVDDGSNGIVWVNDSIAATAKPLLTSETDGLILWATAWATAWSDSDNSAAIIRLAKRPLSRESTIALATAAGLLVLFGCAGHYFYLNREIKRIEANVKTMDDSKKQLAADTKAADAAEKELTATKQKVVTQLQSNVDLAAKIQSAQTLHRQQQERWTELLNAIAASHSENCWLREIKARDGIATIKGYATDTASALQLTSKLEASAETAGWQTTPAQTYPQENNLVAFEFSLSVASASAPVRDLSTVAANRPQVAPTASRAPVNTGTRASRRRASAANRTTLASENSP